MRSAPLAPALFAAALLALSTAPPRLGAQEPAVNGTVPGAVPPGQAVNLLLQGGNLAGAKRLWTSFPAEAVLAEGVADNGTKADQVTYKLTVPPTTPVGIHGLRLLTDKGVSPLRFLIVDDLPSLPQQGGNNSPATAQVLPGPCGVDGAIGNLTVQYFKLTVAENQRLTMEVLARRIGSALDPMLRLLDARGREVAFSDDAPGLNGDAQIDYTFKAAGEYLLELRDIRYQGGAYRLRVGDFPAATVAYPLAIQRGQQAAVTLAGVGGDNLAPVTVTAPTDPTIAFVPVSVKRNGGASSGFSQVEIADRPQFLETEPNNAPEQANRIELGADVNGRLEQKGDVDRFVFAAKKDQSFVFTGVTRTQGSPTDLNLKILNKDGGQVAAVDDTGTSEGTVTVKFPADGDYTLLVEDLNKRGGPDHAYRVTIAPAATPFTLAASLDTFNIPAGGAVGVTVTAVRQGYAGPIELSVVGLPEGLTASRSVIGPGRNDALLTITAKPDFAAGVLHAARVVGKAKIGEAETAVTADFTGVLKARYANMRFPPAALATNVAVAAAPAPGFAWRAEPPEIVFGKDLSAKVKLIAQRAAGFEEAVAIAVTPPQNGLPAGVTAAVKNIDKGAGEVEIVYSANNQAPLGDFTAGLQGTLKQGDKTVVQLAAVRLSLQAPMTVSADFGGAKVARGAELAVKVKVARNPALTAPVTVTFQNLPKGVTAAAATIPPEAAEVEIKLAAAADAAQGAVNNVVVKTDATVGNAKFEAVSGNLTLTVE